MFQAVEIVAEGKWETRRGRDERARQVWHKTAYVKKKDE